ncbi:glucosamine 6-phosphate N-acetyltransferase-like isoform X2 [Tripterygium wilfordii]|uniref:glucosamine 6-phosphate N-acetyltransferase-like isoform X2 n=1 Tax=Tripterygium wilfordii TaxID=458696 RepID=UPI0018F84430|nr:glucosamine 6-phosphate N-acetyltransferase-like isoform X2 [Tripterygium wilfordii]
MGTHPCVQFFKLKAAIGGKSSNPNGEGKFQVRKLEISDQSKGFIEPLQQLSVCDSVSNKEFEERFQELSSYGDDHLICVIEDDLSGKIIASGSIFIEKKFLRNCGKVGHIEDVVVDANERRLQLGKRVVEFLTEHAHGLGCYKVILDCGLENKAFYEKCGFKQKEIQMVKYFI